MMQRLRYSRLLDRIGNTYDAVFKEQHIRLVERWVIYLALTGFIIHLLLIFLTKHCVFCQMQGLHLPTNYLRSIYTPFSIILFYEVLMLVVLLPKSIAVFIGKQYEIITLITIRSFFHDIAQYDLDKPEIHTLDFLQDISLDLVGALLLFFLTIVYYMIYKKTKKPRTTATFKKNRFINIKKASALLLSILLLGLSVSSLAGWVTEIYRVGAGRSSDPNAIFYKDFFNAMIFADVFLLILSIIYSGAYEVIFRNAGFVISTILVRISLTAEKPFNIYFALTATAFGVLLMALFVFYTRQLHDPSVEVSDGAE